MPKSRTLGTLTIGQAPRPDVTPILDSHIPERIKRIHRGVLDGLSRSEIDARYAAVPGDGVLVTRLLDGSSVELARSKMVPAVQAKIAGLEAEGADVVLLLCTGTFEGLRCERAWLLEPDHVIPPAASALTQGRQLGIIVPVASQMQSESRKWAALKRPPIFAASSPYKDDAATLARAGAELKERGAEALLLDCIGFTERHRRPLVEATGLPVILSNALAAKILGELFE